MIKFTFKMAMKRSGGGYMRPCKFFAQGTCRNGNNCRFSHASFDSTQINSGFNAPSVSPFGTSANRATSGVESAGMTEAGRALAIEELKNASIWLLSGFGIAKGLPNVVDGDVSAEEARWEAYQDLKTSGNCMQSTQKLQVLAKEQQNQRHRVLTLLENYQSAQKLFAGETLATTNSFNGQNPVASPFTSGGAVNPFQSATPSTSPFGDRSVATNPFQTATVPTASPFSIPGNTEAIGSTFRSNSLSTTFGTPSTSGAQGSVFGSSAATNSFGGNATTLKAATFGQPSTPTTSPFGALSTSTFGVTPAPVSTVSPFGNVSNSTSPFGADSLKSDAKGLPSTSPFGVVNNAPLNSPFGGFKGTTTSLKSTTLSTATTFGENPSSTVFNVSSKTTATPLQTSSISSNPFMMARTSTTSKRDGDLSETTSTCASNTSTSAAMTPRPPPNMQDFAPDNQDDAWNLKQFEQEEFTLGMVPTVPPPPELC